MGKIPDITVEPLPKDAAELAARWLEAEAERRFRVVRNARRERNAARFDASCIEIERTARELSTAATILRAMHDILPPLPPMDVPPTRLVGIPILPEGERDG